MTENNLRIVSRKSPLALWQANFVKSALQMHYPELNISILTVTTTGDKILDQPLTRIGGKGLFVKELEQALLNNQADIAVHSMKDLPATLPTGLMLAAILPREDSRDVLITRQGLGLTALASNAIVGTSSLRRQAQLLALNSDFTIKILRGNVETRLEKLHRGEYDAIILAAAGLKRLGLSHFMHHVFEASEILPAVGQGALGIECREADGWWEKLQVIHDQQTAACVLAERQMNAHLGGSCLLPVAGLAECLEDGQLHLQGMVGTVDGKRILKANAYGDPLHPKKLGEAVAHTLSEQGANDILASLAL